MVEAALIRSPRKLSILALIGFALLIATPMLVILLMVSFVGIGVALLLLALYLLLIMLSYVYAGLIAGSVLLRLVTKKTSATWKAAILGMFALYLLTLIPFVGGLVAFVLMLVAAGALFRIAYRFAWKRDA